MGFIHGHYTYKNQNTAFAKNLVQFFSAANKSLMDKKLYKSKFAIILHNVRIFQLFRGAVRSAWNVQ